ncbi:MAG TPA: nucleotidyltransferase domain-containing protein, partial [Planctomycetaceae bacterium]|nr:nucleotidyltransferase domain-containing protein [Planctomycetaceae bacterium]
PFPLLFATISGAHLYGFPSPDSDYDIRGTHSIPLTEAVSLWPDRHDTIEVSGIRDGLEIDLVTHDIRKFFGLMLKKNGYVMEQVFSPLIVRTSPEHDELKAIARQCLTRHHVHHYQGFVSTQWKLFENESPRRVKPLLYVYRVLLTGIHLMRTGEVEANLVTLNETYRLPQVPDLVARKLSGPELSTLPDDDFAFHESECEQLRTALNEAAAVSQLPEAPRGEAALNDLLVRLRMRS